jgi:hypothetical protein
VRRTFWFFLMGLLVGCGGLGDQGTAPRLDPIKDPYVLVGEKLSLVISATDPDGGDLTFKIADRPTAAQFIALDDGQSALFTWIPEVTDSEAGGKPYEVEFFVLDGDGLWDSALVTITVMPQAAAQFLNPPGYVLDLAEENTIEFLVQVKDDSATQVDIVIADGPEGAYIEQSDNKSAYFFWRPTEEQISLKLFWYVRFQATGYAPDPARPGQEDQLYQITYDVAIVITNPDYAGCPGTPPVVEHNILADQYAAPGATGYPLEIEILEIDSKVQQADVRWSTTPGASEESYATLVLKSSDGSNFGGSLPLAGGNTGKFLNYFLEVADNDDFGGPTCDHEVRVPKEGHYTTAVYPPGADSNCLEDNYEPNNTFSDAHFLMDAGSYSNLRICGSNTDYFGFMASGSGMSVTVQAFGNGEALVWQAQDGMGNPVHGLQSGSKSISVPGEKLSGGVLLIALWSDNEEAVTYNLTVATETGECDPDSLEPNETSTTAELIGEGTFEDLSLCAGDEDFFRLEVPAGTFLSAVLTHAASVGDLDLYLLESDGESTIDAALTSSDEEKVEANISAGGTHYLKVVGFQGATNSYHLSVDFEKQVDSCQEDTFAPNQYADEAVMVPPSNYKQLAACPGKEDWFAIGLNGSETLDVTVTPGSGLQLHLEEPGGTTLCNGQAEGSSMAFSCAIPGAGDYRFRVSNSGATALSYDMEVAVTPPAGPCQDDRFESNNQVAAAAQIINTTTTWLTCCGMDADWFHFSGYSQDVVFVGVVFDQWAGDLKLTLLDETGITALATSYSAAEKPYVEATLPATGEYNVLVEGVDFSGNVPYNLLIWVN